jgi:sugar (pentulose or hexulose) kinase
MEGVAYGTEQNLRLFRENGFDVKELVICGGAANSPLWMQIHADVSNVPIVLTRVSEAATLGSAVLGAVAGGIYPSIPEATSRMVQVTGKIEPNPDAHEAYRFYYDSYAQTYPAMKDLLHGMVRHVARRS